MLALGHGEAESYLGTVENSIIKEPQCFSLC